MSRTKYQKSLQGFTLIEVMIVVAIVAILAAIAVPAYQEQVRKSRRADVKTDMAQIVLCLERFHAVNETYVGSAGAASCGGLLAQVRDPYIVTMDPVPTVNAFMLVATPQGTQVQDLCGILTLNQAGQRTRSGTADFDDCW